MRDIAREELIAELRGLRADLARQGITRVALFGSRARRDNRPDSDVDLVVDVDAGRKFSLIDLVGVVHTVEDRVGLDANIFMRRSLDAAFRTTVDRDQVVIF
ncbi:nucleotidyltransferase domain-containing protein [Devosia sp.]|jgi:predicted nucleotidyltransferase|uniref:nucleotidyltransferase domain-containing protein n=1 Tax=Devosia sp. TaxID=1871048 RepID=UPI0039C85910